MSKDTRADRTTMEGMIFNANHVLDSALDPTLKGVPKDFFKACKGIVLISVIELGFIFSGNVGSGVVMAKSGDGRWSNPSAIGLAGVGFGFILGAEIKDVLIFIMDNSTMECFSGSGQIKFGGQVALTIGPVGREADVSLQLGDRGAGGTIAYTMSKGVFGGVSLEGAIIAARPDENGRFYGRKLMVDDILFRQDVTAPEGSGIPELHEKLEKLQAGGTSQVTAEVSQAKESRKDSINKAAESIRASQAGIVYVDGKEEAEKEASLKTSS